jgi:hypothetical protein
LEALSEMLVCGFFADCQRVLHKSQALTENPLIWLKAERFDLQTFIE